MTWTGHPSFFSVAGKSWEDMREARWAGSHPQPAARRGPPRVQLTTCSRSSGWSASAFIMVDGHLLNNIAALRRHRSAPGPPAPGAAKPSEAARRAAPPPGRNEPGRAPKGEDPAARRRRGGPRGTRGGAGRAKPSPERAKADHPRREAEGPEGRGKRQAQRGPGRSQPEGAEPGPRPRPEAGPPGGSARRARRRAPAPIGRASERGTKRAVPRRGRRSPSGRGAQAAEGGRGQPAARGGRGPGVPLDAREPATGRPGTGGADGQGPESPRGPDPEPLRGAGPKPRGRRRSPASWAKPSRAAKRPLWQLRRCSSWGGTTTPPQGRCVTCDGEKVCGNVGISGRFFPFEQ